MMKVIRRAVKKLSCGDDSQDSCVVGSLLGWCTAAQTLIGIKLRLLQLLGGVEDKVGRHVCVDTSFRTSVP